jgi:hypothetical protein
LPSEGSFGGGALGEDGQCSLGIALTSTAYMLCSPLWVTSGQLVSFCKHWFEETVQAYVCCTWTHSDLNGAQMPVLQIPLPSGALPSQ